MSRGFRLGGQIRFESSSAALSWWLLAWDAFVWKASTLLHLCNNAVSRSALGSDATSLPSLASSQSTWGTLRQSLKSLSVEFAVLSDKAAQQVRPSAPPHPRRRSLWPRVINASADVLRGDERRMMLWRNWICSWICCSRTEWVRGSRSWSLPGGVTDLSWQEVSFNEMEQNWSWYNRAISHCCVLMELHVRGNTSIVCN